MALDLAPYMSAIAVGGDVSSITGKLSDSVPAGSYAAFINSITGSVPTVIALPDNRAKIVMSEAQAKSFSIWIDSHIKKSFAAKEPARVEYEIGPAIMPIALKYSLPTSLGLMTLGFVLGRFMFR